MRFDRATDFVHSTLVPSIVSFWQTLDVPSWAVYHPALIQWWSDISTVTQSTKDVAYLTFKPLIVLCWMIGKVIWRILQLLCGILLHQGWISFQNAVIQVKAAAKWSYHFQKSLTQNQLIGEGMIIISIISTYYLYKWMCRQTYWHRFTGWFNVKRKRGFQAIKQFIDSVARVSLILAMALPHGTFLCGYVAVKVLFPSFVKWLAFDTYATSLISMWYPLIMTVSWVHEARHGKRSIDQNTDTPNTSKANPPSISTPCRGKKDPSRRRSCLKHEEERNQKNDNGVSQTRGRAHSSSAACVSALQSAQSPKTSESQISYWLRYWIAFSLAHSVGGLIQLVPIFGTVITQYPHVVLFCSEMKLLFFIWVFAMEGIVGAAFSEETSMMGKTRPLTLLYSLFVPILIEFEAVVAEAFPRQIWEMLVRNKVQKLLEVLVMINILSKDRKDWIQRVLEESRTLLLPSISLMMPSFITAFGVLYVQYVVPSAKSTRALTSTRRRRGLNCEISKELEVLFLQYWVIHCLVSGVISYFSSVIWWIPFSTHATFVMWCHLSFPDTITNTYNIFENEIIAFGLLPGNTDVTFHNTKTIKALTVLYKRLPSASENSCSEVVSQDTNNNHNKLEFGRNVSPNDSHALHQHASELIEHLSADADFDTSEKFVPPVKASDSSASAETETTSLASDFTPMLTRRSTRSQRKDTHDKKKL